MGLEPTLRGWKPRVLPLHYVRLDFAPGVGFEPTWDFSARLTAACFLRSATPECRAHSRNCTRDPSLTRRELYWLSYVSKLVRALVEN